MPSPPQLVPSSGGPIADKTIHQNAEQLNILETGLALTRGLDLVPVGAQEALAELGVPGAGGHRGAPLAPVVEPGQHTVRGCSLELTTNFREDFTIMKKDPSLLGPSPQ